MTHGNMDHLWVPYVGNLRLTNQVIVAQNYTVQDDGTYFYFSAPFLAAGLTYKVSAFKILLAFCLSRQDAASNLVQLLQ